jgi:hypothetical protein
MVEFRDVNKRLGSDEVDSVWIVKAGAWAVANNCRLLLSIDDDHSDDEITTITTITHAEGGRTRPAGAADSVVGGVGGVCHMATTGGESTHGGPAAAAVALLRQRLRNAGSCFAYQKLGQSHGWRRDYQERMKHHARLAALSEQNSSSSSSGGSSNGVPRVRACELWALDQLCGERTEVHEHEDEEDAGEEEDGADAANERAGGQPLLSQ